MPTNLSEKEIKKLESNFFKSVQKRHLVLTGCKVIITGYEDARFKGRIKKECREFIKSCENNVEANEAKLDLASLRFAEFISEQTTRDFSYTQEMIGTKKSLAKNVLTKNIPFPVIGTLCNAAFLKYSGSRYLVPDYSNKTKEDFKNGFKGIFSSIMPMNDDQLKNESKELSKKLISKSLEKFEEDLSKGGVLESKIVESLSPKGISISRQPNPNFITGTTFSPLVSTPRKTER
jgi:hypothetical protein